MHNLYEFWIHFNLVSSGKTVYSILPQSTRLQNGCLELVCYMLPAALEYSSGDWNGYPCAQCLLGEECRTFRWIQDYKVNTFTFSVVIRHTQVGYIDKSILAIVSLTRITSGCASEISHQHTCLGLGHT